MSSGEWQKGTKRRLRLVGGGDCMGRAVDAEAWQGSGNPKARRGRKGRRATVDQMPINHTHIYIYICIYMYLWHFYST